LNQKLSASLLSKFHKYFLEMIRHELPRTRHIFRILFAVICVYMSINVNAQNTALTLQSPDKNLTITFQVLTEKDSQLPEGKLVYSATFKGESVIEQSALSLHFSDNELPLGQKVRITGSRTSSKEENYNLITGKTSRVHDYFNSLEFTTEESGYSGRKLTIEARAYNDALAFRYHLE